MMDTSSPEDKGGKPREGGSAGKMYKVFYRKEKLWRLFAINHQQRMWRTVKMRALDLVAFLHLVDHSTLDPLRDMR